jgi:pilus assembly protein TadC
VPSLLMALVAAVAFVLGVVGYRVMRSTGLEAVAETLVDSGEAVERPPAMARVLDGMGLGLQRLLLGLYGPRRRARLDERLARAGRPEGFTERSFLRRKAGFAMVGLVICGLLWMTGNFFLGVVVAVLCSVWMDVWLRTVTNRRRKEIARGLPDFLDVLAVTVSAGLALQTALERVSASDPGALGQEIRRTLNDMRYGISRRAALTALRDRNDVPSLSTFVTAMLQAEELGTPLAQALMEIAAEVRRESAQQARQVAAKAGPKVSLVVTMTIVPGAMLLIISAMVLANLPKFRDVFG